MSYIESSLVAVSGIQHIDKNLCVWHMLHNMNEPRVKTPLLECIQLIRSTKRLITKFDRILQPHGITINQWEALNHLMDRGTIRPSDFTENMGVIHSTAIRSLNLLQEAGLIRRVLNKEDGRSFLLEVTSLGKRRMEQVSKVLEKFSNEITNGISKTELKTLSSILDQIVRNTKVEES
jgi:DNA-binding MarR family transcriptional regulator